ncbi:MAG: helix-turn-helix transcriptional regulator [Ruminiclostridium sp.]|nr:helix-turn-helix transcriptional regulator [Ruminiclostridium sp.]
MKLYIGETIKRLRKEKDITQEEFSEFIGVSCQSVSRWENGACYPDIELIPLIASFFGISTDKLLGIDEISEKETVEKYKSEFQENISKGNIEECIRISRKAVAEYPNNYILLNMLMYALFVSGSDDADIPDWKENMEKYDDEIIALGERIIKYCDDTEIKLEATARLAFQHCEMGRKSIGRSIYESMPSMEWCKERVMWWALEENEKIPHLRKSIRDAYNLLDGFIYRLQKTLPPSDALKVIEKEYELCDIMYDKKSVFGSWANANTHFRHAKCLAELNRDNEAIEHIKISIQASAEFDKRPEKTETESILLGKQIINRTDYDTADSRPLQEILLNSWLQDKAFDKIRETDKYKEIIKNYIKL